MRPPGKSVHVPRGAARGSLPAMGCCAMLPRGDCRARESRGRSPPAPRLDALQMPSAQARSVSVETGVLSSALPSVPVCRWFRLSRRCPPQLRLRGVESDAPPHEKLRPAIPPAGGPTFCRLGWQAPGQYGNSLVTQELLRTAGRNRGRRVKALFNAMERCVQQLQGETASTAGLRLPASALRACPAPARAPMPRACLQAGFDLARLCLAPARRPGSTAGCGPSAYPCLHSRHGHRYVPASIGYRPCGLARAVDQTLCDPLPARGDGRRPSPRLIRRYMKSEAEAPVHSTVDWPFDYP
ncbi:MAG: hypothetical protein MAG453_00882 [Calditrichaeota bacterium]|nr:hypothetical protein [Calditrichota bacterium]